MQSSAGDEGEYSTVVMAASVSLLPRYPVMDLHSGPD